MRRGAFLSPRRGCRPHVATLRAVVSELKAPAYAPRLACPTPAPPRLPAFNLLLALRPGGSPGPSALSPLPQPFYGAGEALRVLPDPVRAALVTQALPRPAPPRPAAAPPADRAPPRSARPCSADVGCVRAPRPDGRSRRAARRRAPLTPAARMQVGKVDAAVMDCCAQKNVQAVGDPLQVRSPPTTPLKAGGPRPSRAPQITPRPRFIPPKAGGPRLGRARRITRDALSRVGGVDRGRVHPRVGGDFRAAWEARAPRSWREVPERRRGARRLGARVRRHGPLSRPRTSRARPRPPTPPKARGPRLRRAARIAPYRRVPPPLHETPRPPRPAEPRPGDAGGRQVPARKGESRPRVPPPPGPSPLRRAAAR
jgi:hypothetical protein